MNIYKSSLFKYIAGDSLKGKAVPMTIDRVVNENVTGQNDKTEEKQVLYFAESKKGMILNRTNAKRIARWFGPETDDWHGNVIELYTEPVKAFGETHNALRVREAKAQAIANKIKNEQLTTDQHKARRANNPLRIVDDGLIGLIVEDKPIGEDAFDPLQQALRQAQEELQDAASITLRGAFGQFATRVIQAIPFFTTEAQVEAALALMELEYSPDNEQLCFSELALTASNEADMVADKAA